MPDPKKAEEAKAAYRKQKSKAPEAKPKPLKEVKVPPEQWMRIEERLAKTDPALATKLRSRMLTEGIVGEVKGVPGARAGYAGAGLPIARGEPGYAGLEFPEQKARREEERKRKRRWGRQPPTPPPEPTPEEEEERITKEREELFMSLLSPDVFYETTATVPADRPFIPMAAMPKNVRDLLGEYYPGATGWDPTFLNEKQRGLLGMLVEKGQAEEAALRQRMQAQEVQLQTERQMKMRQMFEEQQRQQQQPQPQPAAPARVPGGV